MSLQFFYSVMSELKRKLTVIPNYDQLLQFFLFYTALL